MGRRQECLRHPGCHMTHPSGKKLFHPPSRIGEFHATCLLPKPIWSARCILPSNLCQWLLHVFRLPTSANGQLDVFDPPYSSKVSLLECWMFEQLRHNSGRRAKRVTDWKFETSRARSLAKFRSFICKPYNGALLCLRHTVHRLAPVVSDVTCARHEAGATRDVHSSKSLLGNAVMYGTQEKSEPETWVLWELRTSDKTFGVHAVAHLSST